MGVVAVSRSLNLSGGMGEIISPRVTRPTIKESSGLGELGPTKSFWDIVNSVELPRQGARMRVSNGPELKQLEKLLSMQNKLYQGVVVVELVSKTADAAIHGVKRLQSAS